MYNDFENIFCKMAALLSRARYVKVAAVVYSQIVTL